MSSIDFDIVKNLINQKKYSVISEYAHIGHPDKSDIIINEYAGNGVRIYKDTNGNTRVLCPKDMTYVQEGHVAQAIANGTIFDDADEVDRNATMIERTSIPYEAMVNDGRCTPKHLKPIIAIVIGKMHDDGSFSVDDGDRQNGVNLIKDLSSKKHDVSDVVDNYIEKDKEVPYGMELGKEIRGLRKDVYEICDTDPEDCVTDDDCCDSYDDFDIDALEKGEDKDEDKDENEDNDADEDEEDEETIKESGDGDEGTAETEVVDDSSDSPEEGEEVVEEEAATEATVNGSVNTVPSHMSAQTKSDITTKAAANAANNATSNSIKVPEVKQEGFLSKKPKKLKPIPRDIIAYITVEMNDIHSANDQAMLSGYTCSKIELVDFYLTVLDTQDARYIVPHNKQYLEMMKRELETLLAKILRIRPINRSEQIWRVNYPTT